MSLALRAPVETEIEVSAEARQRINSGRAYDISFFVKQRLGPDWIIGDVEMIVEMIIDASRNKHELTKEYILNYLRNQGRSKDRSEQLASALLK